MDFYELSRAVSSLDFWKRKKIGMSLRRILFCWGRAYRSAALLSLVCGMSWAASYTLNVQLTDAALWTDLMAATTGQYNGTLKPGLFSNSYTLTVTSKKPVTPTTPPAPPIVTLPLDQALALGATVYVYGFANGQEYERKVELGTLSHYAINCSTPSMFSSMVAPWDSRDATICNEVIGTTYNDIYTQNFSTPTIIPVPGL